MHFRQNKEIQEMRTKPLYASLALTLAAMFAMPCAQAQMTPNARFNIPFEFTAGRTSLPAGTYQVWPVTPSAIALQNLGSKEAAVILTTSVQSKQINTAPVLVFRQYGDQYFLARILAPQSNYGREVPANRKQKELARNWASPPAETLVAAK
jgi:hypothetical protein